MGCRSDYLDPTQREHELQRAAKLLVFVLEKTEQHVPNLLKETAKNSYANLDYVPTLCKVLRALGNDDLNRIVYDGRNPTSRDLADWWEEHQKADRARLKKEIDEKTKALKKAEVLLKLNMTEKELKDLLE